MLGRESSTPPPSARIGLVACPAMERALRDPRVRVLLLILLLLLAVTLSIHVAVMGSHGAGGPMRPDPVMELQACLAIVAAVGLLLLAPRLGSTRAHVDPASLPPARSATTTWARGRHPPALGVVLRC